MGMGLRTGLLALVAGATALTSVSCASRKGAPAPVVSEIPAQSFARQWSIELSLGKDAKVEWLRPAGDFMVAFTTERRAYVIRRDSGRLVGVHDIRGAGEVLTPFTNGNFIAYPVSTGLEVHDLNGKLAPRVINLGAAAQTSGTFSDSMLYIPVAGVNGARLRAVDPTRAFDTPKWEVITFGTVTSTPIFFDQALFYATTTGRVYAANEEKAQIWSLPGGFLKTGPVIADLKADELGLYVASTDSKLLCVNRGTGKIRWQYFAGEPLNTAPVPTAEHVYLTVRNEGLVAIHKTEGSFDRKPLWVSRESTMVLAEDDKYTYTRLRGNALGALDKATGVVAFRSGRSDLDFFVPNVGKDALILGATKSGYVVGIKPVTKPGTVGELMFTSEEK